MEQPQAAASDAVPATGDGVTHAVVPAYKLYSVWQIGIAACLCFVAGPILLARSYERLGEVRRGRLSVLLGVAFFVGCLALVLYRPNGNAVSWLVPTGVFIGLIRKPYGAVYRAHVEKGGAREAWWKPIMLAVALALCVGILLLLAHLYLGVPAPFDPA